MIERVPKTFVFAEYTFHTISLIIGFIIGIILG